MANQVGIWIKRVLTILFWFGVWAGFAAVVQTPLLLPSPTAVFVRLFSLIQQPDFWKIIGLSILHIMLGAVCATVLGIVLSILTCRFRLLDMLLSPLLTIVKSTPIASFIILVLIWIGRDRVPAVITGLMVLPVVWNNVSAGIRGMDRDLLEMATLYHLPTGVKLRRIYVPSIMPYFLSAIKTAIGIGWKAGIAAEVLTVPAHSIGKMIYESKLYLETTDLFAWTLVVILISLFIEKIIIAAVGKFANNYKRGVDEHHG